MSTLPFEGYKQVEAFGPDEEYDEEFTEEFYVTLDLGQVDQALIPSSSTYRLIGLDTPTPFLQLSGVVLKGQHQTLLGTELLFTDPIEQKPDIDPSASTPPTRKRNDVEFFASTERRIRFKEVQLKPKQKDVDASVNTSTDEQKGSNIHMNTTPTDGGAVNNAGPSVLRHEESGRTAPEQPEFQIDPFLLSLSAEALAEGSALQMHTDVQAGQPSSSNSLLANMMSANGTAASEVVDSRLNWMVGLQFPADEAERSGRGRGRGRSRGRGRGRGRGGGSSHGQPEDTIMMDVDD